MHRPVLPLGRMAPWLLAAAAIVLLVWGGATGDREIVAFGVVAAAAWLLAFPVTRALLGRDKPDDPPG